MDDPALLCSALVGAIASGPWVHTHGYEAATALLWGTVLCRKWM